MNLEKRNLLQDLTQDQLKSQNRIHVADVNIVGTKIDDDPDIFQTIIFEGLL